MSAELLSDIELRAMRLTVELVHVFGICVSNGPTRADDIREFVAHVHAIQHAIMSQAAARAYPDRFRLLGGIISPERVA